MFFGKFIRRMKARSLMELACLEACERHAEIPPTLMKALVDQAFSAAKILGIFDSIKNPQSLRDVAFSLLIGAIDNNYKAYKKEGDVKMAELSLCCYNALLDVAGHKCLGLSQEVITLSNKKMIEILLK